MLLPIDWLPAEPRELLHSGLPLSKDLLGQTRDRARWADQELLVSAVAPFGMQYRIPPLQLPTIRFDEIAYDPVTQMYRRGETPAFAFGDPSPNAITEPSQEEGDATGTATGTISSIVTRTLTEDAADDDLVDDDDQDDDVD